MSNVWFITGTSRGLGLAIAEAALNAGASVIATARNPSQLDHLVSKYGVDKVLPLALDVSNNDAVLRAVKAGHDKFGRIDIVVNNAGYGDTAAVEDTTVESFHAQINTNLLGVIYVTKAVLPILRKQGSGHIFQVSSLGGRVGTPGLSAYQSAKWAVGGFSTVLAQEVAPLGIKITVLEPGGIRTDWAGSSMKILPVSEPYKQTVGAVTDMLRIHAKEFPSLPEKIADIVLKLSKEKEPPLRLLLGPEAGEYAANAAKTIAESDEKWRYLTLSSF
ncbi:putative oxidoreductase [Lachnellula occidentalis]|uniref:Putative oxidoreductase n=1 Tax=Lachnellula occidentalis TaxID=215460 RepID=A0A8H8UHS3_9HELO|nr:putative oxidoreductase [Lachnellula occidentalis]